MIHLSRFLVASTAIALTAFTPTLVNAATITYNIQVVPDSGSLKGNTYQGFLSYDDSTLTGLGYEAIALSNFGFTFAGNNYNLASSPSAIVNFNDGSFLGLDFGVANSPAPTFISGFFDLSEAFFSYDTGIIGGAGTGEIKYTLQPSNPTTIPEPTAILGLFIFGTCGFVSGLSRQK
ncbi:MAG: hypothetical protein ACKO3K_12500 [Cuspidothrix sp.]